MVQRIAVARAFAVDPDLLLMDEPYGQLDVKLRYYLEDELVASGKTLKSTVIFVTHNIEEAVYVAERDAGLEQQTDQDQGRGQGGPAPAEEPDRPGIRRHPQAGDGADPVVVIPTPA